MNLATFTVARQGGFLLVGLGSNFHAVALAADSPHEEWPAWQERTVCGRAWSAPADPNGDPHLGWEPALAPSCRSCLRSLTVEHADTPTDSRLPSLVDAMATSVLVHGCAICEDVPGDQVDELRRATRARLRGQFGVQTFDLDGEVHVYLRQRSLDLEVLRDLVHQLPTLGTETEQPARDRGRQPWQHKWRDFIEH